MTTETEMLRRELAALQTCPNCGLQYTGHGAEALRDELLEAREGIKEVMTDHAATLQRLDAALSLLREIEPLVSEGCGAYSSNDLQQLTRRILEITTTHREDGSHG